MSTSTATRVLIHAAQKKTVEVGHGHYFKFRIRQAGINFAYCCTITYQGDTVTSEDGATANGAFWRAYQALEGDVRMRFDFAMDEADKAYNLFEAAELRSSDDPRTEIRQPLFDWIFSRRSSWADTSNTHLHGLIEWAAAAVAGTPL